MLSFPIDRNRLDEDSTFGVRHLMILGSSSFASFIGLEYEYVRILEIFNNLLGRLITE